MYIIRRSIINFVIENGTTKFSPIHFSFSEFCSFSGSCTSLLLLRAALYTRYTIVPKLSISSRIVTENAKNGVATNEAGGNDEDIFIVHLAADCLMP